jgi:hypothetical protein
MKTKKAKKFWFLHFTYLDEYGLQHRMRFKMPRDFQSAVKCVFSPDAVERDGYNAILAYENE